MKLVIVGSRGRMGAMLARRLGPEYEVAGIDQPLDGPGAPDLGAAFQGAALVLLCVPVAVFSGVISLLLPHMEPGTVLADITSVKIIPMTAMEKLYDGPVVGTHPLFGPRTESPLPVAVVPGGRAGEEHVELVERLFLSFGCEVFRTTAEEHDRAMAAIQNLNFITSVAYFAMLGRHKEFLPFATPTLRRRKEAARSILTDDAPLFAGLCNANPMSQSTVREFRSFLSVAAGGDLDVLLELAKEMFDETPSAMPGKK